MMQINGLSFFVLYIPAEPSPECERRSYAELIRTFGTEASIIEWAIDIACLVVIGACCYSMRWMTGNMPKNHRQHIRIRARILELNDGFIDLTAPVENAKPLGRPVNQPAETIIE